MLGGMLQQILRVDRGGARLPVGAGWVAVHMFRADGYAGRTGADGAWDHADTVSGQS